MLSEDASTVSVSPPWHADPGTKGKIDHPDTCVTGVGGFALGGGWSWKSNQYGLTIDTITAFDVVTATGKILHVTETSEPDLFFGLKVRIFSTSDTPRVDVTDFAGWIE